MDSTTKKDWTILMYLNGNNELEPEMLNSMLALEGINIISNINIVIEIGREALELVKIIRPAENFNEMGEKWTGVRRYSFINNKIMLTQDLGYKNMADPMNMYEFIKYGIENYEANHYMLIIGGHSCSLIGTTTDYTKERPYIMGIPEMSDAIIKVSNDLKVTIDFLVLDMCYFNFIEIIYEFGKDKQNPIKNILTYIGEGPIYGLPYCNIIKTLEKNILNNDLNFLAKQFIDSLNFNLVAFKIDYFKLENIKGLFNSIGDYYLNNSAKEKLRLNSLFSDSFNNKTLSPLVKELQSSIRGLIVYHKQMENSNSGIVNLITELPADVYQGLFYDRLNFTKFNKWCFLVNSKKIYDYNLVTPSNSKWITIELPIRILYKLIEIINPRLDEDGKKAILENVLKYKKWS